MVRLSLGHADRVTAGSTLLHDLAAPRVAPDRLVVTPLGVDTALFSPSASGALPGDRFNLLHVASLVPVKNQPMLLRAMSEVVQRAPGTELHIVGDGPLRPDLERQARTLALADHVTFHGSVAHERLPDYYRAADLCVMTSRHEASGMVPLEAAACGRATVGARVGILADLTPEDYLVPVDDDRALAALLTRLVRDRALCRALGQQARAQVEARYTLAHTVRAWLDLYAQLARR
ncbi:MAG: glycosyltransferase family 4 protein [Anaerolineae bacterium]|nr:glycosyltransferase family 4 protein [Anaerolineae bacterium]